MAPATYKRFMAHIFSASKDHLPTRVESGPPTPEPEISPALDSEQNSNLGQDASQPASQLQDINVSCLKVCEQSWDHEKDKWVDVLRNPKISDVTKFHKIIVYNRKDGRKAYRDHIWVEFRSKSIVELVKPYFRGLRGFAGLNPGVDARYIYNQRKALEALLTQLTDPSTTITREMKMGYSELQTLLGYIDDEFKDITAQLEDIHQESDPQIEWNMLWALFAQGDLVQTEDPISNHGMAFRLEGWIFHEQLMSNPEFQVRGKYLQWTGRRYVQKDVKRSIEQYTGMQRIGSLSVKPLTESMREELAERGAQYIKVIAHRFIQRSSILRTNVYLHHEKFTGEARHLLYRSNIAWSTQDLPGRSLVKKERADGRVMVDVLSYRRFNPNWDTWESADLGETCAKKETWVCILGEDHPDICTLPPTLQGWSFPAKKWGHLLVTELSPIPFQTDIFKHLVLPEDEKKLIQSLVEAQAGFRGMSLMKDVVSGKGEGLVILLHGGPGTGKTLTAEAVSEHLQLPLYAVSCSEFGTRLEEVEKKLKHILDITSLWKAVVLIDEADIFLEARSEDLKRNAIVGVFLRMLEYHSGIVILTTNRVRSLDDAFRSRISLALKYRDHDHGSRKVLWEKFLGLAGATIQNSNCSAGLTYDFSSDNIDELSRREVNGRVIKHIVRTSQALALSDGERLNLGHIGRVWKLLDAFEADLRPSLYDTGASSKGDLAKSN